MVGKGHAKPPYPLISKHCIHYDGLVATQEVQDYLKTISPNLTIVRGDFDEGNHPDEEASFAKQRLPTMAGLFHELVSDLMSSSADRAFSL